CAGGGDHRQARARFVDCAPLSRRSRYQENERPHPMALVHAIFLRGGCCEHLYPTSRSPVGVTEHSGKAWTYGNALSDRLRTFASNHQASGTSLISAGRLVVDCRWWAFLSSYSSGNNFV